MKIDLEEYARFGIGYSRDGRSAQEVVNGSRGGEHWSPSDYSDHSDPDYSDLEAIQFLLEDEVISDGGRPEGLFDILYDEPENSGEYCVAKGELYDWLTRDIRASEKDAMQVSRLLHKGKVGKAEEMVDELLGDQVVR